MKYDDDENKTSEQEKNTVAVTDIRKIRREQREQRQQQILKEDAEYQENINRISRYKRIQFAILAIVLVIIFVSFFIYFTEVPYTGATESDRKEQASGNNYEGIRYANGFLKYNNDGMSYYNAGGELVWTKTYEMNHPRAFLCDDYVVMSDIGAKKIIICNTDGFQGEAVSPLPVSTLSVSASGVVAAVVEDDAGNHILFFNSSGSKLDIDIRTLMDQSGYPLSVGFSPDGRMLMVSYVYLDQAIISNKIVFYNFQDSAAGSERMVGTFQQYGDTLFGRVAFLDDKHAIAMGDGKIVYYSLKNRMMPTEIRTLTYTHTIVKVIRDHGKLAVIQRNDENSHYLISIYDSNGKLLQELTSDFLPTDVCMKDSLIYYHNDSRLIVLGRSRGVYKVKFDGNLSGPLRTVINVKGDNRYMILSDGAIYKIELKR